MKTWLKRTLIGVATTAALAGSIAAFSQETPFHHGPPSAQDIAQHEAHFLAHISKKLNLDANQQAKLQALVGVMKAQHQALLAGGNPHQRVQALIAGNTFDRAGAQALVTQKVTQIQQNSPALINAIGDFYDSLNATQQQQVRDFAAKHHGWHHAHGASAPTN